MGGAKGPHSVTTSLLKGDRNNQALSGAASGDVPVPPASENVGGGECPSDPTVSRVTPGLCPPPPRRAPGTRHRAAPAARARPSRVGPGRDPDPDPDRDPRTAPAELPPRGAVPGRGGSSALTVLRGHGGHGELADAAAPGLGDAQVALGVGSPGDAEGPLQALAGGRPPARPPQRVAHQREAGGGRGRGEGGRAHAVGQAERGVGTGRAARAAAGTPHLQLPGRQRQRAGGGTGGRPRAEDALKQHRAPAGLRGSAAAGGHRRSGRGAEREAPGSAARRRSLLTPGDGRRGGPIHKNLTHPPPKATSSLAEGGPIRGRPGTPHTPSQLPQFPQAPPRAPGSAARGNRLCRRAGAKGRRGFAAGGSVLLGWVSGVGMAKNRPTVTPGGGRQSTRQPPPPQFLHIIPSRALAGVPGAPTLD